jgi:hypothetical protein
LCKMMLLPYSFTTTVFHHFQGCKRHRL